MKFDAIATLLSLSHDVTEYVLKQCVKEQRAERVTLLDASFDVELLAQLVSFDCCCLIRVE